MPSGPEDFARRRPSDREIDAALPSANARPIGVELLAEREIAQAWEYDAQVLTGSGVLERRVLVLHWADYQMWSPDGAIAPSRVAEAVLRFVSLHPESFAAMERIDAAVARRKVPGADRLIAELLRDG